MPFTDDLALVIARTGVGRYRDLCDPANPAYNPDYPPFVEREASRLRGEPEPEAAPPIRYHDPAKAGGCGCGKPAAAEPPLPPLATMAANYARAMALHALDGFASVDPATYEARLAACLAPCPLYRPSDHRCSGCGCPVAEAAKIRTKPRPEGCRWPA